MADRDEALRERIAQLTAHRVCIGLEHDGPNGKLHGYCVVCGVPWPCDYAGKPPELREAGGAEEVCSVCAGAGTPPSGRPCICGGRGTLMAEAEGLRQALYAARSPGGTEGDR